MDFRENRSTGVNRPKGRAQRFVEPANSEKFHMLGCDDSRQRACTTYFRKLLRPSPWIVNGTAYGAVFLRFCRRIVTDRFDKIANKIVRTFGTSDRLALSVAPIVLLARYAWFARSLLDQVDGFDDRFGADRSPGELDDLARTRRFVNPLFGQ